MAAIITLASLSAPARAQSGPDVSPIIPVHPDVPTIVHLPDEIERVQVRHGGEMMVKGIGSKLYVRPRRDTPAGVEALLEVQTRTVHRILIVQVVERAGDATRELVVPALAETDSLERSAPDVPPATPAPPEPAARAPSSATEADPEASGAATGRAATATAAEPERDAAETGQPGFHLFAQAVIGLGVTSLDPGGHPRTGFQPHYSLGLRLTGERPGSWWAFEAEFSAELLAGALTYRRQGYESELAVSGPRLRAMLATRMQAGTRWIPWVSLGIGAHAHLRESISDLPGDSRSSTMAPGAVLGLGMGLHLRTRAFLLGLDFQVRLGGPDEYRSIMALLTLGRALDQGE